MDATVTIIGVPLNHDHIAAGMPPRDAKLEILKMRFYLRDTRLSAKKFSTLWPPSHSAIDQRRTEVAVPLEFDALIVSLALK
jgi:hypothetical protein